MLKPAVKTSGWYIRVPEFYSQLLILAFYQYSSGGSSHVQGIRAGPTFCLSYILPQIKKNPEMFGEY